MKLFITGGQGSLGLWFVEHFLANGWSVTVLGRTERVYINHPNYRFITADVANRQLLELVVDEYYDYCIHAASLNEHFLEGYAEKALAINALGTDNLCHALNKHGVGKLIYISTFHVYGASSGCVHENTPVIPKNDYGLTHYFAEKYIEKHHHLNGLNYCIFRLSNSYGCPKDLNTDKWYLLLNDLCRSAVRSGKIVLQGDGSSKRDFIWMGDVVKVVEIALANDQLQSGCFNLSSGKTYQVKDLALKVLDVYRRLYNQELKTNLDLTKVPDSEGLSVDNTRLLSCIDYVFEERIDEEAESIMRLIEQAENG